MSAALYGERGFYRHTAPAAHFATSAHVPLFAEAVRRLAARVDADLGRPDPFDVVDLGAGGGELLDALAPAAPARWRLTAVEIRPRPGGRVRWRSTLPAGVTGLVFANEWLDTVPVDVVQLTADGPRVVLVDERGAETLGGPPEDADLRWLDRWWPLQHVGERAEVGRLRDAAWLGVVGSIARGVGVAVDYAHRRGARPAYGTLTGYRAGRVVLPVPDGSCDITAHLALDACAAAVVPRPSVLTTQRAALHALGITGGRPAPGGDPEMYLAALARAGAAAELTAPGGLGGFGWLVTGCGVPPPLASRS